ncbi:peroxiredoxin family protein [Mycolicibacterium mucogenicum]|uniref:peroxiredoxin family protein n=1 Tax=Mycolicibacterium mucogenicum TaxID=56689 RepID=UPI00226AFE0F|nr:peroxiredoxin family protein [Mycolicibacterium mucogenicum]MCX8565159.1 peroxiredoxin family protein [Mycolicibacterium mucogenicum]
MTKSVTTPRRPPSPRHRRRRFALVGVLAVLAVAVLYLVYRGGGGAPPTASNSTGSGYPHVAGTPGAGSAAPAFTLTAGDGKPVSLSDYHGKTVLLYFQEGLSCQPCWNQIGDLEQHEAALRAAGVDAVVSITTDPADLIGRKATDERLSTPVLSDPDLAVSRAYGANKYGMMGDMRDGHSFVLVGPDGTIRWRADYGGAPKYTMFLPTGKVLADLTAERLR